MTRHLPLIAFSALTALSCQKETKTADPATPPTPPPIANGVVAISSVTLLEDCPDADPEEAKRESMALDMDRAEGDSIEGYRQPCQQSAMQIAVTGQGDSSASLEIVQLRLLSPSGDTLDTLKPRSPTIWRENQYSPWDQIIASKTDVSASYKLSSADWNAVEKALGGSSYGPMFIIEADVQLGGEKSTIRSSPVAREPIHMIET